MKHNLSARTSVAIIGMPRSGTTIVASFINSLDRATIFGEAGKLPKLFNDPRPFDTRYGRLMMLPQENILKQIEGFAIKHDLLIYGTKNVFDPWVDPTSMDYSEYDHVYVMFRNPRKVWSSMVALNNASGLGMNVDMFIEKHRDFVDFCLSTEKAKPIILDRFRESPIAYMSQQMGIEINGPVVLEQYTGGGDPNAIKDKEVRRKSQRVPDENPALDKAASAYMEVYRL